MIGKHLLLNVLCKHLIFTIHMNITNIKNWNLDIHPSKQKPFLISGPCSAETEEQVLQTCTQIASLGVDILRAGIWKPRTRPGSFEGIGSKALPWLIKAGKQTNLPVCCEVATPQHVEEALKYGIDVLWIGARTTVNPFAVQAIADVLQGVDIPVMIKNPVNPDLELWIGAIERIAQAGISKIAAIHRGFSVYNAPKYRDLNFDGFMLESHINPDGAWSDAKQQVSPKALEILLNELITRQLDTDNLDYLHKIDQFRTLIDNLDTQTLYLLSERMEIVRQIGLHKKESNIAILQIERWLNVRESALKKAATANLSESFVEDIINTIHKESIRQQTTIMRKN